MATLCHICGCPLHPFGFQPLPCLHLRASHGYRSVVWSDCLASLHSSTGTLMVRVDHVMIHPAHRTCTSITCAPFRSSTYVPSIRILFRVSSRWIDGISLRWLRGCGQRMQTVTSAVRKNCGQKVTSLYCGKSSHARGTKRAPNNRPDRRGAAHDASALKFCIRQRRDGGALAERPLLWGRAKREQARHRAGGGQVAADPHGGAKSGDHHADTWANCR